MSVINMAGQLIEEDAGHLSFNASPQGHILNTFRILGVYE